MSEQLWKDAIERRLVVEFESDDKRRTGEPHALGVQKDGLAVELFQTHSSDDSPPRWRTFYLENISNATITDRAFVCRRDFNPYQDRWERLDVFVKP